MLLSFFILTTKPKSSEAINVVTPSSVASKAAPTADIVLITIDKNGKVFLSMDDEGKKEYIANSLNTTKGLNLNVAAFKKAEFWGTAFAQLPSFLALPVEKRLGDAMPGIPVDTTKSTNELTEWLTLASKAYAGHKMNLLLKGDNNSKYPAFKAVIDAFKKNDLLKFEMITNPESVPVGSELFKNPPKKAE